MIQLVMRLLAQTYRLTGLALGRNVAFSVPCDGSEVLLVLTSD
jgi:hypothetical protein